MRRRVEGTLQDEYADEGTEYVGEEIKALYREGAWLMATEVPKVTKALLYQLNRALWSLSHDSELISYQTTPIEIPGKTPYVASRLRGNVKITGTSVEGGVGRTDLFSSN